MMKQVIKATKVAGKAAGMVLTGFAVKWSAEELWKGGKEVVAKAKELKIFQKEEETEEDED